MNKLENVGNALDDNVGTKMIGRKNVFLIILIVIIL